MLRHYKSIMFYLSATQAVCELRDGLKVCVFSGLPRLSFWLNSFKFPTLFSSLVVRRVASLLSSLFCWFLIFATSWLVYTYPTLRSWLLITASSAQKIEKIIVYLVSASLLDSRKYSLSENQNVCGDSLWSLFFFPQVSQLYVACLLS